MKIAMAILPVIALALSSPQPSFADCDHGKHVGHGCEARAAPAPLIGLGLPGMVIAIGFGAYLLVRHRRNVS